MVFDAEERQLVGRLLTEVRTRGPLDRERERELARVMHAGSDARARLQEGVPLPNDQRAELEELARSGRDAKQELVTAHLPLVVGMAKRYRWAPISFLELIQEGTLGLLRAAERFDRRRGTPFGAYASWWVRHAMSRAVRETTGSVRLPQGKRDDLRRLAEAREADPEATTYALGEASGLGEAGAESLGPLLGTVRPVDARELEDLLADRDAEEELEEVLVSFEVSRLLEAADRLLNQRQRNVLEARYGLGGREPRTLREIAEELGVSVQRVSQIERSALDRLRSELTVTE
jgi:RNA polymerase sigma factor (sigma-70 family)